MPLRLVIGIVILKSQSPENHVNHVNHVIRVMTSISEEEKPLDESVARMI